MTAPTESKGKYEVTVAGKRVKFKKRFPAKTHIPLLDLLSHMADEGETVPIAKVIDLLPWFVDEWEFDGDPHDPASYGELDVFDELIPLATALSDVLEEKMGKFAS